MKLVLIDDHSIFRIGLRDIITSTSDWRVVGEASRARDAFPIIDSERPDMVIMDMALEGSMDGVIATREVRRRAPNTRVVILSVHEEIRDVVDALDAGASGYVLKWEEPDAILGALAAATRDEQYVTPVLATRLVAQRNEHYARDVLKVLSEREREVFRLAAECLVTRDIARELCISRKTVDTHLYRIHLKLGLRTAAELVKLASRLGLIHSGRLHQTPRLTAIDVGQTELPLALAPGPGLPVHRAAPEG